MYQYFKKFNFIYHANTEWASNKLPKVKGLLMSTLINLVAVETGVSVQTNCASHRKLRLVCLLFLHLEKNKNIHQFNSQPSGPVPFPGPEDVWNRAKQCCITEAR